MKTMRSALLLLIAGISLVTGIFAQASAGTSPSAVIRAYTQALVSDNYVAALSYNARYRSTISSATKKLPRTMWDDKKREIQRGFISTMIRARNENQFYPYRQPWVIFKRGSNVQLVDLQVNHIGPGQDPSWRAFIKVMYPSVNDSPDFLSESPGTGPELRRWRRLKQVTVYLGVHKDRATGQYYVDESATVVEGTVSFWSAPAITDKVAVDIAANVIPRLEWGVWLPAVKFRLRPGNWMDGPPFSMPLQFPLGANAVEKFKSILKKYEVTILEAKTEDGVFTFAGLQPPDDWKRYQYGNPDDIAIPYSLCESIKVETTDARMTGDSTAAATIHFKCNNNPIAKFVLELRGFQIESSPAVDRVFLDYHPYTNFQHTKDNWSSDKVFMFNYEYDGVKGWTGWSIGHRVL